MSRPEPRLAAPDREHAPEPDAVRVDPAASYEAAARAPEVTDTERAVVSAQLGRPARGRTAVVDRCAFGLPTTVRVHPRLDDGTPFPTVFWSTCPLLNRTIGTLEGEHVMVEVNDALASDPDLAAGYAAASERYVAFRDELGGPLPGNPSAGGMPGHVKCLHVAAGHTLATGDNPVGHDTLERITPLACPGPCVSEQDVEHWSGVLARGDRRG
ncbi:MAG: DUF501 domain-containing protein [Actinomycetes bacterium]